MCCDDAEMHVRDFRLLLELCRAASLPTRLAALVCIPLSWCIGVGYTLYFAGGGCSVVSHSECDLAAVSDRGAEAWFFSSATGIDRPIVPDF